jgi:hypothetical protein
MLWPPIAVLLLASNKRGCMCESRLHISVQSSSPEPLKSFPGITAVRHHKPSCQLRMTCSSRITAGAGTDAYLPMTTLLAVSDRQHRCQSGFRYATFTAPCSRGLAYDLLAANISAREMVVLGKVRGNIDASDRVDMRSEGSLIGDVITWRISIGDDAFFEGSMEISKLAPRIT